MIDMYSPYISLIKKLFQNANIIIDKFHLINFISISLNKTRIKIMKYEKKQVQISTHLFKFLYHYFGLHPLFDKEPHSLNTYSHMFSTALDSVVSVIDSLEDD